MKTMTKIVVSLLISFCVAYAPAQAADDTGTISGVPQGQTQLSCTQGSGKVTLKISEFPLVRVQEEGAFPASFGAKLLHNDILNKDDYVVFPGKAISSGTIFVFGLGTDWANMEKPVDRLDTSKALGSGTISNGIATVSVPVKSDIMWYRLNAIAVVGGVRAWVGNETQSGYGARDVDGNPLWVVGQDCQKPNAAVLAKVAAMK